MSEIGKLTPSTRGDLSYLSGHIQTMDGRLSIALEGNPKERDQNRPSHRITTRTRDGSILQSGAAWLKTSKHGPHAGTPFFSIQIDHHELRQAINVAAFEDSNTGEWTIVWRRSTPQAATPA
jgi:uncharacterized protein (DUF736 family)